MSAIRDLSGSGPRVGGAAGVGRPETLLEGGLYGLTVAGAVFLLVAYILDLLLVRLDWPQLLLPFAATLVVTFLLAWRRGVRLALGASQLVGAAVPTGLILLYALYRAWPTLYPVSGSVDVVHHFLLADYIQRTHGLVHDPAATAYLQEFADYPFGTALIAAFVGWLSGLDVIGLLHPLGSASLALVGLFVYVTIWELLPKSPVRMPLAVVGALLLLLPRRYFVGQIADDFFLAQVVAQVWLVAFLYWLTRLQSVWSVTRALPVAGATFGMTFTYPNWLPACGLAFAAVLLASRQASLRRRLVAAAVVAAPLVPVVVQFVYDRWQTGLRTILVGGVANEPSLGLLTVPLVLLAPVGLVLTLRRPERKALGALAVAFALQYAAMLGAMALGLSSWYTVKKLWYEQVVLMVPLAALALGSGLGEILRLLSPLAGWRVVRIVRKHATVVVLCLFIAGLALGSAVAIPRLANRYVPPPMGPDLYAVATWARATRPDAQYAYVTRNGLIAYWLDVGILRHDRGSGSRGLSFLSHAPPSRVEDWLSDPRQPDLALVENLEGSAPIGVEVLFQRGRSALLSRQPAR